MEILKGLLKMHLGIARILQRRAGRGSDKGDVEGSNNLIGQLIRNIEGKVKKLRKDIKHASKRSVIDYKRLNSIICLSVMELNNTRQCVEVLDRNMVAAGIDATPNSIWDWGMKNLMGHKSPVHIADLQTALMPEGDATITGKGILFEDRYYVNPDCSKYFDHARSTGRRLPTKVRFTRTTSNFIAWNPEGKVYKLTLATRSRRFKDYSADEANEYRETERRQNKVAKVFRAGSRVKFVRQIDAITKDSLREIGKRPHPKGMKSDTSVEERRKAAGEAERQAIADRTSARLDKGATPPPGTGTIAENEVGAAHHIEPDIALPKPAEMPQKSFNLNNLFADKLYA
jgi:hypothetical protein